ncbi:MAG: hypothetical protein ABFS08_12970 [Pseudomonadota bacterium]
MKTRLLSLLLILPLMFTGISHADEGWNGNINLHLGSKVLNSDDWWAYAHGETGIFIDVGHSSWPVNIVFDLLGSRGKFEELDYTPALGVFYVEEEVTTGELNLGVRHYFNTRSSMRPYVGGGLALITLESDLRIDSGPLLHDEGHGSGIWLNGGIVWGFNAFNLGFDMRVSAAEVEMDAGDFQGGGAHTGLILGYHW